MSCHGWKRPPLLLISYDLQGRVFVGRLKRNARDSCYEYDESTIVYIDKYFYSVEQAYEYLSKIPRKDGLRYITSLPKFVVRKRRKSKIESNLKKGEK